MGPCPVIGPNPLLPADLNNDGDTDDLVVQLWPGAGPVQNLGLAATALSLSETYVAALATDVEIRGRVLGYRAIGLPAGALVLVNEDLVKTVPDRPGLRVHTVPATRIAEGLGRVMVANIVMFGFITALADLVNFDSARQALLDSVPPGTEDLNLRALRKGHDYGVELLAQKGEVTP